MSERDFGGGTSKGFAPSEAAMLNWKLNAGI
jgi:hypothetical protein